METKTIPMVKVIRLSLYIEKEAGLFIDAMRLFDIFCIEVGIGDNDRYFVLSSYEMTKREAEYAVYKDAGIPEEQIMKLLDKPPKKVLVS